MASLLSNIARVPIDTLQTHPDNPRRGNIEAIASSLAINGQFQPIVVQTSTSFILAGNHTYLAAISLDWEEIDIVRIDVDDDLATRILLAANRTADLGEYDEILLASLLGEIREEDEDLLLGTGYSVEEVDELLANALAFDIEFDDSGEGVEIAARIFDRIMPATDRDLDIPLDPDMGLDADAPKKRPSFHPPSEFVAFRFGELRAKVTREAYETFLKGFLDSHGKDLSKAAVEAAIMLGVEADGVHPAVAEGAERWL